MLKFLLVHNDVSFDDFYLFFCFESRAITFDVFSTLSKL